MIAVCDPIMEERMPRQAMRKRLNASGLLALSRQCFERIEDETPVRAYRLVDCLMSALATFGLKSPSLLQFDREVRLDGRVRGNLRRLYQVDRVPCDTQMRTRLDRVPARALRPVFRRLFRELQRGKVLKPYAVYGHHYLLSLAGTGFFASGAVRCKYCCERRHRDGTVTYHHQMLAGAIVHTDCRAVIPLAPEPIVRQDGQAKNDCERNASKRFLEALRREHPHLQVIVLEDGLASNGPHLDLLERLNLRYLIGARENDHAMLFQHLEGTSVDWFADPSEEGRAVDRRLRVVEDAPLSASRSDRRVTVLQCRERTPKRVKKPERQWTWITDLPVTRAEAPATARMAHSRWKIENETSNTLKNQGYGLEHNYGHGHQYLANTLATLMMLAFLMDQIQQLCCPRFQAAQRRQSSYASLWEKMRGAIWLLILHSWEQLYEALAGAEPDRSSGRPDPGFRPP